MLDATADPAGVEGLVDVNEGQRMSLTADVRQVPPMPEAREAFDLKQQDSGEVIYLHADAVTVQK